jgi:DNA-directed RNA polymerase specialized sigma24 family protein
MAMSATSDSPDVEGLISLAASGDARAMGELFDRFRDRLRTLVRLRMDRKLQGRVDPSDILQETFMEASRRIGKFAQERSMPVFLWLRFLAAQRLLITHRRHVGAKKRAAKGEISLHRESMPQAEFPAFEAYATINDGAGMALFQIKPPPGSTVWKLPGWPRKRVSVIIRDDNGDGVFDFRRER